MACCFHASVSSCEHGSPGHHAQFHDNRGWAGHGASVAGELWQITSVVLAVSTAGSSGANQQLRFFQSLVLVRTNIYGGTPALLNLVATLAFVTLG